MRALRASTPKQVWYHGSERPRETWDLSSVGHGNDQEGPGLYFSSSLADAAAYGSYLSIVELPLQKSKVIPLRGRPDIAAIRALISKSPDLEDHLMDWDENPAKALNKAVQVIFSAAKHPFDAFQQVWYDFYRDTPQEYLKNLPYDGAVVPRANGIFHAIVFNPTVIKTLKQLPTQEALAQA